jgi:hypothetical protein
MNQSQQYEDQSPGEIQEINHKGDAQFFFEVHVLAGTLHPRCVDHHFVVRRLIGNLKPSSPRAPQEPTVTEITQ